MCMLIGLKYCVVSKTYEHCAMVNCMFVWIVIPGGEHFSVARHPPITSYIICSMWECIGLLHLFSMLGKSLQGIGIGFYVGCECCTIADVGRVTTGVKVA